MVQKKDVEDCINVLIKFKRGELGRQQALTKFIFLSGLSSETAKSFFHINEKNPPSKRKKNLGTHLELGSNVIPFVKK